MRRLLQTKLSSIADDESAIGLKPLEGKLLDMRNSIFKTWLIPLSKHCEDLPEIPTLEHVDLDGPHDCFIKGHQE